MKDRPEAELIAGNFKQECQILYAGSAHLGKHKAGRERRDYYKLCSPRTKSLFSSYIHSLSFQNFQKKVELSNMNSPYFLLFVYIQQISLCLIFNSVSFDKFIELFKYQNNQIQKRSSTPPPNSLVLLYSVKPPPPQQSWETTDLFFTHSFKMFYEWIWLLLLTMMHLRSIHVIRCICS